MSKQVSNEVEREVERGWEALEAGDVDGARAALSRARKLSKPAGVKNGHNRERAADTNDPEVAFLGAAIAELDGDVEGALEACLRAHELAPDEPRYLLGAADIALGELDDPQTAIDLCDQALDRASEEDHVIAGVLLKTEALLSLGTGEGEEDEASELLNELEGCTIDDPSVYCRVGELRMALGDLDKAEEAYAAAVKLDDEWSDAHHGLGAVYKERGDDARMTKSWLRVRELDMAAPPPMLRLEHDEFEKVAEAALAELPREALDRLANVPVLVEDVPSEDLIAQGTDPRLLGLFSGVPYPEKFSVNGQVPSLDAIHLFQRNLERTSDSLETLADEIRITVLHETAHFFGLDDDQLDRMGLG